MPTDWIRDRVVAQAKELGLSPYAVAKRTLGRVSVRQVQRYFAGTHSLTSDRLQHVLTVLSLVLQPA